MRPRSGNKPRATALVAAVSLLAAGLVGGFKVRWASRAPESVPLLSANSKEPSGLEEHLSRCRLYGGASAGMEPDWKKAELACNRALDLDPISDEANGLLKRVKQEQTAFDLFTRAESALQTLDEVGALDLLSQIPETSAYFRKAKPQAMEIKKQAESKLQPECAKLLRSGAWRSALVTCEKYIALICQDMAARKRGPAGGEKLVDVGSGRPPDPLFPLFLRARAKVEPGAAPWRCPEKKLLRESEESLDGQRRAKEALLQRFSDKRMGQALFSYWQGNIRGALAGLQTISTAGELRNRIWLVLQLLKAGNSALQAQDPERAQKPFRAALQHDRELLGHLEQSPSFVERSIRREMGSHSYHRGKYWADRADTHRACRIWKLGYSFSRANLALLQAVKHCSERGVQLLAAARHCGEIAKAAELSIEGDGLLEKLAAKRAALGCP